jgi:hypothetical protein
MLLKSQAHIDIEMWSSLIMHLWSQHLLQQQKASNPISKAQTWLEKQFKKYSILILFTDVTTKLVCDTGKLSSASLCELDINPSILWKGMNLSNVSSFIRISSIYIAIFKYTMWISFCPQKSPNMWNYKSICLSLWWNSRLSANWIALWLLL